MEDGDLGVTESVKNIGFWKSLWAGAMTLFKSMLLIGIFAGLWFAVLGATFGYTAKIWCVCTLIALALSIFRAVIEMLSKIEDKLDALNLLLRGCENSKPKEKE